MALQVLLLRCPHPKANHQWGIQNGVTANSPMIGGGYWVWFGHAVQKYRFAVLRSKSRCHLLGNLTVVGLLVFVIGRVLFESR